MAGVVGAGWSGVGGGGGGVCNQEGPVCCATSYTICYLHCSVTRALCGGASHRVQDRSTMDSIASYFRHPIPEVSWNDEDEFISVLNKAGLTDQTV